MLGGEVCLALSGALYDVHKHTHTKLQRVVYFTTELAVNTARLSQPLVSPFPNRGCKSKRDLAKAYTSMREKLRKLDRSYHNVYTEGTEIYYL